jgi:hypothetical protein
MRLRTAVTTTLDDTLNATRAFGIEAFPIKRAPERCFDFVLGVRVTLHGGEMGVDAVGRGLCGRTAKTDKSRDRERRACVMVHRILRLF